MNADVRQARRYVFAMAITTVVLIGSIPAVNLAVDPLGYARAAGWRPANPDPTEIQFAPYGSWPVPHGTEEAKVLDVKFYRPESVVFGSSTVWSYLDVRNPVLRESDGRTAYNFGLAGASIRKLLGAYEHVVALHPPKRAVVGLEFYMFSADKPSYGFFDLPLAQQPTYREDLNRFVGKRLLSADYTYAAQAELWAPVIKAAQSLWTQLAGPKVGASGLAAQAPPVARVDREKFLQSMLEGDRVIITGLYPPPGKPFRLVDDEGW